MNIRRMLQKAISFLSVLALVCTLVHTGPNLALTPPAGVQPQGGQHIFATLVMMFQFLAGWPHFGPTRRCLL